MDKMGITFRIRFILSADMKHISDRDEFISDIKRKVASYFVDETKFDPQITHDAEDLWSDISYGSRFSGDSVGLAIYVIITPNQIDMIEQNDVKDDLVNICSGYEYFQDVEIDPTDSARRI